MQLEVLPWTDSFCFTSCSIKKRYRSRSAVTGQGARPTFQRVDSMGVTAHASRSARLTARFA
jgi:hypothetical protein